METGSSNDKIPVTVITGVLGAGKTTLIQQIMRRDFGEKRVAIIQNEVSEEMGIESPILTDGNGEPLKDFYELPSGCLCCSAKSGLIATLETLVEISSSSSRPIFLILVETTGIADPLPLSEIFWVDSGLDSNLLFNGFVTVVDSLNFEKSLANNLLGEVCKRQVVCADAVILNKTDLITTNRLEELENRVRHMQGSRSCRVFRSRFGVLLEDDDVVEFEKILCDLGVYGEIPPVIDFSDENSCHSGISHHFFKFENSLEIFSIEKLNRSIGQLLWEYPETRFFRLKGLFRGRSQEEVQNNEVCWFSLQGVGNIFEIKPVNLAIHQVSSKFLFITNDLVSRKEILDSLSAAISIIDVKNTENPS